MTAASLVAWLGSTGAGSDSILLGNPVIDEFVVPVGLLVIVIALVAATLKRDEPRDIAIEFGKLVVMLSVGFVLFCVALALLADPNAPFR